METGEALAFQWPYLLSLLPPVAELERSARRFGALVRKREVRSAEALLRLALAYGVLGLSLRQTAAWAQVAGIANVSDVALLKRLRAADGWLGHVLGLKLAERAPLPTASGTLRLRLVDATVISRPGSTGTDWRVHLGFNLASFSIDHLELTDGHGGETLTRFEFSRGDLVVGDRGYSHRRGLHAVTAAGADYVVRLNWQNLPLRRLDGGVFDLFGFLRMLPEAAAEEAAVVVAANPRHATLAMPARIVAIRRSEAAATAARARAMKSSAKKGKRLDPRTLESAGYLFVLTSVPAHRLPAAHILESYRFRWQIELAFKRLKSLLFMDELSARDPPLARTFIYAKLIAALLLEDYTERFLAFSPWGYRLS